MGAIANGMLYHGGVRPFVRDVLRVLRLHAARGAAGGARPSCRSIYMWTHDSVGLGEDGPTHQPVEHLDVAARDAQPDVFRPADADEAAESWRFAMTNVHGPTGARAARARSCPCSTARPGAPGARARRVRARRRRGRGAGRDPDRDRLARSRWRSRRATLLAEDGDRARAWCRCRAGSCSPRRTQAYREEVLPPSRHRAGLDRGGVDVRLASAGSATAAIAIGIDRFGACAPGEVNMREYGITAAAAADAVRRLVREAAPR